MTAAARHLAMTADAVGGVWTHAVDLAAALVPLGTHTTLVVLGPGPDAARRAEAEAVPGLTLLDSGLPLDWLATSEAEVALAARALAAIVKRSGADLVQLNSPALAAFVSFGRPVVGVCHSCLATWWATMRDGAMPADFAWRRDLLARGYAACDVLVAPSWAFAAETARAYGIAPEVVHNGRVVAGAAATASAPFAFTAGRLWDEGKGAVTLDRAAALLDIPLYAAGPLQGPNGVSMTPRHLAALGPLGTAALRDWLARGPIFVSAAQYEPFGLAVLEAAQAGCALVLSDVPTFRELWDGAARFVTPGDANGFAVAIRELSRNGEQRSCLGVAAMQRAVAYTAEAMASGMAAIHARLLDRRAAGGRNAA